MTTEPEENVTDASPSQTEPAAPNGGPGSGAEGPEPERDGAKPEAAGADAADTRDAKPDNAPKNGAPKPPRWSEQQPEPAPWYVGRPGAAPPGASAGWGVAAPPQYLPAPPRPGAGPGPDLGSQGPYGQSPYGPHAPGGAQGQPGARGPQSPNADRPEAPEVPGPSAEGTQGSPSQPPSPGASADSPQDSPEQPASPEAPVAPPQPPQSPYDPPPMQPWHDPNRYGSPQRQQPPRQQQDDPWRRRQEQQPAQEEPRGPLDLRTRWARGLALGSIACTLASIWYSITNFPTWMIGAGAGLVLGLVGLWLGVFAQRAALAKGKRAPVAVGAIVWSSIASLLSLMILAFSLIFYTQLSQLSNCMRSATTISAQNQCETNFQNQFGVPR